MTVLRFDNRPIGQLTIDSVLENRAEYLEENPYIFYGPEDRDVSYTEMNRIANSIANALGNLGVERQEVVSVMIRHPLQTLFTFFGLQKRGAIYSPINYDFKGQTLLYQINDSSPNKLILEDQYINRLNEIKDDLDCLPHIIVYETESDSEMLDSDFTQSSFDQLFKGNENAPDINVHWSDIASILYTSGTTGDPKGVVQPHRWAINNQSEFIWQFQSQEDIVHASLPLYHIGGLYSAVVGSMIAGGSVALWDKFSSSEFWQRVEKYNATQVMLLGSMIPWLANTPETKDDHWNTINKVTMIPLVEDHVEIAERFGFDVVLSVYGSTEVGSPLAGIIHAARGENATPDELQQGMSTDAVLERAEELGVPVVEQPSSPGWIGNAAWKDGKVEVAIVNELDEKLPEEEIGELVLRPEQPEMLFKEYADDPQRTVEARRNLWYHTGDLAYFDENGYYFFVDRKGDVIRRRGENISSGQVQDIVNTHWSVNRSAAFPVPAEEGGEDELAIAVELEEGTSIDEEQLRRYLQKEMPEYMIPKFIMFVQTIPTTDTNKMEKYKLRNDLLEREGLT